MYFFSLSNVLHHSRLQTLLLPAAQCRGSGEGIWSVQNDLYLHLLPPHVFPPLHWGLSMGYSPSRKSLLQCGSPMGCRGTSAPAPGTLSPRSPYLALASTGLFLTVFSSCPACQAFWHFYPFLNMLSPSCPHHGWGVQLCPAVGHLEADSCVWHRYLASSHRDHPD